MILVIEFFSLATTPTKAAIFEWNNAAGGSWETASNWTLVSGAGTPPPDIGDTAEFDLIGVYTVNYVQLTGLTTWELDKILVTGGAVTIDGRGGGQLGTSSFLKLETGAAQIEINGGGQLILHDSGDGVLFTVTVGSFLNVRNGFLDIDEDVTVETADLVLGASAPGESGEVRILNGGSLVDTSAVFTNAFGLNGASGTLTIEDGTVTLAGDTLLGVSGTSGSTGVITVANSSDLFLDNLQLGGTIAGATGSLTLSGNGLAQQSGASTLIVGGTAGAGTITILNDATLDTGTGTITLNATGQIDVAGGTFQADGFLDFQGGQVNLSGGELVLNNGMDAITPGGVFNFTGGTVRVEAGLARLKTSLNFGGPSDAERANLIVENGAQAEVQFAVRPGFTAGTFGRVEVTGVGSTLRGTGGGAGADLLIGGAGDGQLEMTEGAYASFRDDFVVGEQAGANGTALVRGSRSAGRSILEVILGGSGATVSVGAAGTGVLDIENGALVQSGNDVFLASGASGDATVTVGFGPSCGGFFNPCSTFDATLQSGEDVFVGGGSSAAGGTGVLNVNDGGLVIAPNRLRIYGPGTVNLDGGRIDLGILEVQGGMLNFTDGELHFTGSATFDANLAAAIGGASGSHNAGLISVTDTLSITAPFT